MRIYGQHLLAYVGSAPGDTQAAVGNGDQIYAWCEAALADVQVLNEPDFATVLKWTPSGDFAFAGAQAVYTDATHTGKISQAAADFANPATASTVYSFAYEVIANTLTGPAVLKVVNTFTGSNVTLVATVGARRVDLTVGAGVPTAFEIQVTGATGGGITLDNLSLDLKSKDSGLVRGDWVLWDLADNTINYIAKETRGLRVLAAGEDKSCRVAGVVESASATGTTGMGRANTFLVQCFGFHNAAKVTTTAAKTAPFGLVHSSTTKIAREIKAGDELAQCIGFGFLDLNGAGPTTMVFVRCM